MNIFLYDVPSLQCRECQTFIVLPYAQIPPADPDPASGTEATSQLQWPPDGWSVIYACSQCGGIARYQASEVGPDIDEAKGLQARNSSASCYRVELECARANCRAPATVHAENPSRDEATLLRLFREGFFHGDLPCGHPLMPVPENRYRIARVMDRLW